MRFSRAGGTGLSLSKVMYGNLRYPGDADRAELVAHTRAALDAGITSFDTADIYGISTVERSTLLRASPRARSHSKIP